MWKYGKYITLQYNITIFQDIFSIHYVHHDIHLRSYELEQGKRTSNAALKKKKNFQTL